MSRDLIANEEEKEMRKSRFDIVALVVLIWTAEAVVAERVYEINKVFSGSSAPIAQDLNSDGIPAVRGLGRGPGFSMRYPLRPTLLGHPNPSEGAAQGDFVAEAAPVEEPTGRCAGDELEFEVIYYSSVIQYWDGDLLVSGLKDGFTCLNPSTGLSLGVIRLELLGGTGRFEGARGELVREVEGRALNPFGLRSLLTGRDTGELILP